MEERVTLNLDVKLSAKRQAEGVLARLGIPMSAAIEMYLDQICRCGGLPFAVDVPPPPRSINADLMTDDELRAAIREGLADASAGRARGAREAFAEFRASRG